MQQWKKAEQEYPLLDRDGVREILQVAARESWTQLALVPSQFSDRVVRVTLAEWAQSHIFRTFGDDLPTLRDMRLEMPSLRRLALVGQSLDLVDMGQRWRALTHLALPYSSIGPNDAKVIGSSFQSLVSLDLAHNHVGSDGAMAIASSLRSLVSLDLLNNIVGAEGIKAIASSLHSLTSLGLARNSIDDNGAMTIAASLHSLVSLDLHENFIGDSGAKAIASSLQSLVSLDLGGNSIGDKGAKAIASSCTSLELLNLSGNKRLTAHGFADVLEAIDQRPHTNRLRVLKVDDCQDFSALIPYELLATSDAETILSAYRRRHDSQALNEVKVMVVGNEAVGKTSLIRYLVKNQPCNPGELKTPGIVLNEKIDISHWINAQSKVTINIWDFGGQELMHGTHRFFLTRRSLYLLVLEARREDSQDEALAHWLKVIRSRGGDSPVLVVVNKAEPEHAYHPDEAAWRKEFPSIVGFFRTTCNADSTSVDAIQRLREAINRTIEGDERLRHARDPIPIAWLDVKKRLGALAQQRKTVDYAEYVRLCSTHERPRRRIEDPAEQRGLLLLLHDLGVVVAHGLEADANAALREVTLLDPNWLTQAIYRILNSSLLRDRQAVFEGDKLDDYLDPKEYPRERYEFIVGMMLHRDIGLCFELRGKRGLYLVPEALPKMPPEVLAERGAALSFRYTYSLLPAGLIPRLIVEAHELLSPDRPTVWKSGAIFHRGDSVVCVERPVTNAGSGKPRVDIQVWGPAKQRRETLAVIRDHLERVHRMHEELGEEARVPLPDDAGLDVSYTHLIKLEQTKGADYSWLPEKAQREYSVTELLEGVRGPLDAVESQPAAAFSPSSGSSTKRRSSAKRLATYATAITALGGLVVAVYTAVVSSGCKEGERVECSANCPMGEAPSKLCSERKWGGCECRPTSITSVSTAVQPAPSTARPPKEF